MKDSGCLNISILGLCCSSVALKLIVLRVNETFEVLKLTKKLNSIGSPSR